MPPKKKTEEKKEMPTFYGRMGTNLSVGIVGLPNVGKSTFFNVLCKMNVPAANVPFCTIDPNESQARVPDNRFDWLVDHFKPKKNFPAHLKVHDIAGLVQGAADGEGLGNAFLSHINACDAIFHMVRAFPDDDVTHYMSRVDPVEDMAIIHEELRLKDEEFINKAVEHLDKSRAKDKDAENRLVILKTIQEWVVDQKKDVRLKQDWTNKEIEVLQEVLMLTSKPVIYLINLSEKDYIRKKNKWLSKIAAWITENKPGSMIIPYSAVFEQKLSDLGEEGAKEYCAEKGATSALDKIVVQGFRALNLEYFFTVGADEVKAWTISKGTLAPQAAGRIHTDMEKGFIMAETMNYDDFKDLGSEAKVKEAGKYKQNGKNYVVNDGDILHFKFNAPKAPKKK